MAEKKTTTKSAAKKRTNTRPKMTEAQKAAKKALEEEEKAKLRKKKQIKSEIISILVIAIGVFFILSMLTNACGMVGIAVAKLLKGLLGKVSYVLPFFMVVIGVLVFAQKTALLTWRSFICGVLLFIFLSALVAGLVQPLKGAQSYAISMADLKLIYAQGSESGGFIGVLIGALLLNTVGSIGLRIITVVGIIIMLMFIIDTPISKLFDDLKLKNEARREIRAQRLEEKEAKKLQEMEEQLTVEDIKTEPKKIEIKSDKTDEKQVSKALPVLNTKAIKDFEEKVTNEVIEETAVPEIEDFVPEIKEIPIYREYEGEDITENKRKILDYVADDSLFSSDVSSEPGHGMPEDVLEKFAPKNSTIHDTKIGIELSELINEEIKQDTDHTENNLPQTEAKPVSYKFPPISLLNKAPSSKGSNASDMNSQKQLLEKTLQSFGVNASVVDVVKGPAVTRFEVQPAPGVQVSKIVHLQDDIALNLRAKSIRIEAPIPGKAAVGIEVSNDSTQAVMLRDLIDSKEFKSQKSKIAVTLGKSISGENIICDIHEMPHLLIGGTTGSGKSVCMDSMLVSLLYHARPDEVKLILIDPKIVELTPFNGIPHLLIPVVTEPSKAAVALSWAVNEMNERYNKFAEEGVKDLQSYNETVKFKGLSDQVMPEVIIVIDELADLIMAAKNQVEDSICRLAQKARAAGMHLVIATQRPSADIITGVIKANVPSRIALSVSSGIDSRVIIDMSGAENLLGKGDMLYSPQSLSKPIRVQGTFISDNELHAVIDFVKAQGSGEYDGEIMNAIDKVGSNNVAGNNDDGTDELFMDAVETIVLAEKCSVSMLQRRFRIGYNRAARIVDMMEERGIVGPADGSNARKVLMSKSEYDEYVQRTSELDYGM